MSSYSNLLNSPSVKKLAGAATPGGTQQLSTSNTPALSQAARIAPAVQASQTPASSLTKGAPTMTPATPQTLAGAKMIAPSTAGRASKLLTQGSSATAPASSQGPSATDQASAGFSNPTSYYQQANNAITQQEQTAQKFGGDQIAANQRRAATLAALSGRGLGEGFLSGQAQATIEGVNSTQQQINQMEQQRQQIYGQEAQGAQAVQQQNTQNAFDMEQQTAQNNAAANAQSFGASQQNAASQAQSSLKALGVDPVGHTGPAWGTFAPLYNALNSAQTPQQLQAAQAALNAAIAKLNALKQQNPKAKGQDWNAIVERAEKNGYFSGNGGPAYNPPKIGF